MTKQLFLYLVFLILGYTAHCQVNARHFMLAGRIDLSEERYVDAIRNFNTALSTQEDNFEAYFLRGVAKFSLGDFQGAIDDFTTTLRIHPLYARAWHYRGIANDRISNYHNALADFDHAMQIDPYNADLHVAGGATRMHLNQFKSAIESYNQALLINPTIAYAYLNRGLAKRFLGDTLQAVEDLNKAVYYDYFDADAWIRRGMLRYELNDTSGSMNDFDQAILLDDKNPMVYFQRALVWLKRGDTTLAMNDYEKVNMLDQRNALTYYNRALVYSIRKDYEPAEALYREVLRINPNNVYAYFNLGIVHLHMKKYDDAEADFSAAITIFPDFAGAWVNRSIVKDKKGDAKGSHTDYQNALGILAAVNGKREDPDALFARYADSTFFNKIIELESDFVSGNIKTNKVQFQEVEIEPFPNFVVAVVKEDQPGKSGRQTYYLDASLLVLDQPGLNRYKVAYIREDLLKNKRNNGMASMLMAFDSLSDALGRTQEARFFRGVGQHAVQNYRNAEHLYEEIFSNQQLGPLARHNYAVLLFDKEELVLSEVAYNNSITITMQHSTDDSNVFEQREPDYTKALNEINQLLKVHPGLAMAQYNKGNILMHSRNFQRAIDAYSDALESNPQLAEAWYNRALTLLYLGENGLACSDLSKAGELGITEAYAVIRKYCDK